MPYGLAWTGKYGVASANGLGLPIVADGMNEKGLAGGILNFPGYAKFQQVGPDEATRSIASFELLTYVLTNFANVDAVREGLAKIKVNEAPQMILKMPVPVHVTLHDRAGRNLVIEYVDGKLYMYDNPTGVLTNAPDFPWQLTHLGLYGNLSPNEPPLRKVGNLAIAQPLSGGGLAGMPGNFPFPFALRSRLHVRGQPPAVADGARCHGRRAAYPQQFDIPAGAIRTQENERAGGGVAGYETAECSAVADMKRGIYAIWDYANATPRYLDFSKLDFGAKHLKLIAFDQKPAYIDLTK